MTSQVINNKRYDEDFEPGFYFVETTAVYIAVFELFDF